MKLQVDWELLKDNSNLNLVIGNSREHKDENFAICTDSRTYLSGEVFIALSGENFDGFNFCEEVINKGCEIIVFDNNEKNISVVERLNKNFPHVSFLATTSSLNYYQELARKYALIWRNNNPNRMIIGITGSNGKTTQKEMLFNFLNSIRPGKVYATEKNYNNHIGVPRTLLKLNENIDYIIVEMGTNHVGEIKTLCDIACPNAGIITNIGEAHIGYFNSRENIFKEKSALFFSVMENTKYKGFFILDKENEYLKKLPKFENVIFYNDDNVRCDYDYQKVTINYKGESFCLINDQLIGKHNFNNLVSTFLMSINLFPDKEDRNNLIEAAKNFRSLKNRSSLITIKDKTYYLDAYNASPTSMIASVEGFISYCSTNKIDLNDVLFILGDMNELGDFSQSEHTKIGEFLLDKRISNAVFIGRFNQFYATGFKNSSIRCASTLDFKKDHWQKLQNKYKYFFVKGSRSLLLETLIET